jgi:hypothetical protein
MSKTRALFKREAAGSLNFRRGKRRTSVPLIRLSATFSRKGRRRSSATALNFWDISSA